MKTCHSLIVGAIREYRLYHINLNLVAFNSSVKVSLFDVLDPMTHSGVFFQARLYLYLKQTLLAQVQ